jgi:class 3 adenylate cyclase
VSERFLSFDDLLDAFFRDPAAEGELARRYATRAAVLVVDFDGMVRRTDVEGIAYALALARAAERVMRPAIEARAGQVVKRVADTFIAVLPSPAVALDAALEALTAMRAFNRSRTGAIGDHSRNDPIRPCMGLGYGDVLVIPGTDVYGEEANRAFVLGEDVADGGELLVTSRFLEALGELPPGIGAQQAPHDREHDVGFAWHVVQDFRA